SNIRALLVSGATLYAAASTGPFVGGRPPAVYRSTDQGRNWAQVAGNLPISERGEVNALAVSGDSVLVATVDGVFRSDGGQAWTPANNGLTNARTNALVQAGALLFAGTEGSGIFVSTDNGRAWTEANTGVRHTDLSALAANGATLLA